MATFSNAARQAALNAVGALMNNGFFVLYQTGPAEVATLGLAPTPFQDATANNPSVATSGLISADASITGTLPVTLLTFALQTSGAANVISGTVGTSGTDLVVTDNVVPDTATSVTCSGLTLSLTM